MRVITFQIVVSCACALLSGNAFIVNWVLFLCTFKLACSTKLPVWTVGSQHVSKEQTHLPGAVLLKACSVGPPTCKKIALGHLV